MAVICRWNCSDNYVDDLLNTPIEYTSPSGGKEWLPLRNETGKALYPPTSMGIGPQSLSAYTGSGGRATFKFLGQEVAVYGSEFGTGTESSYTLDGEVAAVHTSQNLGLGVLLFYAGVLSATTHTLVIEVVGASDASPFTLDWIEYNNTARGATSPVSNTSYAPSQPKSSASASSSEGGSTASAVSASHASKASFSAASLAGGVVGGLEGLTALVLTYLALRSRRRWRMNGNAKYAYGEVAQYDSDSLGVPAVDGGSTPAILVTNAEDTTSLRSVNPSGVFVPPSNQTVLESWERRTARQLGNTFVARPHIRHNNCTMWSDVYDGWLPFQFSRDPGCRWVYHNYLWYRPGTYTRVAVYICIPRSPINITGAAFATYIIDGTPVGAGYVPFADLNLFVPRFAHFVSDMMIAIPGGTHNLTIQASGDANHPYLLDYIVLYDQYLGPDRPYPGSPTYVSSLSASSTSAASTTTTSDSTAAQRPASLNLTTTSRTLSETSTTSAGLDTLPSASSQPVPSNPVRTYIAGAVLGGVAASAALFALSYIMYRRHRKHDRRPPMSANDTLNDMRSLDCRPLMAEADAQPVVTTPLRAAETHPYDVPTITAEGLYSTLVRHQTGKGKIKEIRLQPSRTSLDVSFDAMPGTSAVSSALFEDDCPDDLPLYSSPP